MARAIEKALVRAIPVLIGFLASLVGITGLTARIQKIIGKVRKKIDKVITKIIKKAKRLFGGKKKGKKVTNKDLKDDDKKSESSKEHDEKVGEGLRYLHTLEKEQDKDKNKKITEEDAKLIAQKTKKKHPIFKSITPKESGKKWIYHWKASDGKEKGIGSEEGEKERLSREKARELIESAKREHDFIKLTLQRIASSRGGKMEGLRYSLKEEDSLTRKISDRLKRSKIERLGLQGAINEMAEKINDVLRFTMILEADKYSENYEIVKGELDAQKIKPTGRVFNAWNKEGIAYKGLNVTFETASGQQFELQFHTPESFDTKQRVHNLYEIERDPNSTREQREDANRQNFEAWQNVEIPPGAERLT